MINLNVWAIRWGVSVEALQDLRQQMGIRTDPDQNASEGSEGAAQALVRLEASRLGARLWRNNVGTCQDERGNFIRYGLANDSKKLNAAVKSADLIGIRPVLIQQEHLGTVIGQFISREIKRPGWKFSGSAREAAQLGWADLILSLGGDAGFATGEGTL